MQILSEYVCFHSVLIKHLQYAQHYVRNLGYSSG